MFLFYIQIFGGCTLMVEDDLYNVRCNEDSLYMSRYMRNQFKFLGVKSPLRKEIQNRYFRGMNEFDREFVKRLYLGEYREFKYVSIDYMIRNKHHLKRDDILLIKHMIVSEPWWDTVDLISSNLVGYICIKYPHIVGEHLKYWIDDSNIWLNRASIIFQLRYRDNTNTEFLKQSIEGNMHKQDFFIQKAIGWSLREYSKSNDKWVINFVHNHSLSNLARREAMKFLNRR